MYSPTCSTFHFPRGLVIHYALKHGFCILNTEARQCVLLCRREELLRLTNLRESKFAAMCEINSISLRWGENVGVVSVYS